MEIPVHKKRFVMLAAFDAYEKTLAKAKKANEDAHCSTRDNDEKLVILESLKAEYQDNNGELGLTGTPMGEQMTAAHYKDDDGTDLSADALDNWMRATAGLYVPIAVIAEWVLEKRKLIAAWLRGIDKNREEQQSAKIAELAETDDGKAASAAGDHVVLTVEQSLAIFEDAQRVGRTCAPDFIDVAWFTPPTPVPARRLTDLEVDEWVTKGPWGVADYHDSDEKPEDAVTTPGTEWELVKRDGTDAAKIIDRSDFVYDSLAESRHEAAVRNRNLFEAAEGAADQPVATLSDEPAELHPA
jgi:hypothetical protein